MKMLFINGTVYFGVDTMTIILSTCAAYGVVRIIRYILDKNGKTDGKYTVIIKITAGNAGFRHLQTAETEWLIVSADCL